jgi:hypothetical protein
MKGIVKSALFNFPIQNSPRQGEILSLLLFDLALEYAIRKIMWD